MLSLEPPPPLPPTAYHVDRLRKLAHIIDLIGWTEPLERPAADHTCHITCRAPTCDELGHAVKG